MSSPSVAPPASAPAALAAFLRGVERRGAVLAELQAGDAAAGDAALAAAMAGFRPMAADLPMSEWPRAFWVRLLADPRLQHRTQVALPLDATDRLAELGSGPRAALLLRLAAGLDEAAAARVLGIAQPTYRLALQRALPHHADGRADPQAWQRLREQVHRRIKTLAPERLQRLAQARGAALLGRAPAVAAADESSAPVRPRRLLGLLWALLVLCAVALAATFWWPAGGLDTWLGARMDPDQRPVRSRPLPPAQAPASRYGVQAGAVAHRDFALLVDPEGEAIARELDYYSWLAAQQANGGSIAATASTADPGSTLASGMPADGTALVPAPAASAESNDAPR
ncbi:hypothetical protein ACFQZQ_05710 [Lysobacter koreensis]|uniref:RNA polymerase sigma factor 70 region 4 type 2 domain-containing protein n=1 Tax=Lysobacter koreensis TaxID=266122 RepID=A0ABW2YKP7_9GAMM